MDHGSKPCWIELLHPLTSLEWKECSEMPLGTSDAQAVLLGGKVYVGGGDVYPGPQAALLIYDFTDDSWDLLNTPTENYALTAYSSQLVLVGGKNPITESITNQLWVLDQQHQWTQPLPPMATKCFRASAVSINHHLIVAGGLDNNLDPLNVVEIYDGHQWKCAHPLPKAGSSMKSGLFEGMWYLAGGDEQETGVLYTSLCSLITITSSETARQTSAWRTLPNAPHEWSTPVIFGKELAAVGGHPYSSAVHVFSHSTNSWVYVENLPIACHSTCTLVLPTGELLVVGGDSKNGILSRTFKAKIEVTSFPTGHFTMSALDRLEALTGISIWNQIAHNYLTLAAALQLDHSILNNLRMENNPVDGSKAMFQAWLSGKSCVEPTWRSLLEKLHTVQMRELAEEISFFFSRPPCTSPSAPLISEKKKAELELAIESKEQQTKPDYRDVAVQSSPDCQDAAVQAVVDSTGSIRGVEVSGETEFIVLTQESSFKWSGYGLRLHFPNACLSAGIVQCKVNVRVSFAGQFQLPEGSALLSPVFWIMAPYKFSKPVTLEIQHCALREDEAALSSLSFISAKCSQKDLPYRFRKVDGGVFTMQCSYGSIQLSHFSGFAITGRRNTPQSYCAHVYHTMMHIYDWRLYFVITQDLEANNMAVQEWYGNFARRDAVLRVRFGDNEITLGIPVDGLVTEKGWRITPLSFPSISRKDADQFEPGRWIPECQLIVEWEREDQRPVRLRHKVDLIGAQPPYDFFYLTLNPDVETLHSSRTCMPSHNHLGDSLSTVGVRAPTPSLKDLMNALYHNVADKWKLIGVYLEINDLSIIETKCHGDSHFCLLEMLDVWLKRVDPPPTWSVIIEAVVFLGEEQLGRELREKYCP